MEEPSALLSLSKVILLAGRIRNLCLIESYLCVLPIDVDEDPVIIIDGLTKNFRVRKDG